VVGGKQPLAAQLGPLAIGIRGEEILRRQWRATLREHLLGANERQTKYRRSGGGLMQKLAALHGGVLLAAIANNSMRGV
jgi:hypothetical protein